MTVPVVYQTTPSPFAERLGNYYKSDYYQTLGNIQDSIWNGRKRLDGYAQMRTAEFTIQEEEYKGHQIVVLGFHREFRHYLDSGTHEHVNDYYRLHNAVVESEPMKSATFIAFGYKIDNSQPLKETLNWSFEHAIIKGTFETDSFDKTMKKAKKRIDLQAKIDAVLDDLIAIAPERLYSNNVERVYNALVGDQVFIHAHGRLRKGIVVDTTGSRFIVGYVTPSNHKELKFKTLSLAFLYTQEKV